LRDNALLLWTNAMNACPDDPKRHDGTNDQREPTFAIRALWQAAKSTAFSAQQFF
jgi:hypothetical protein